MVELFYTTHISVDLAYHGIFHAKVGKGGIITYTTRHFYHHNQMFFNKNL